MANLLVLAVGLNLSRYPISALVNALDVTPEVARLVHDATHAPRTPQLERDRFLARARVIP